MKQQLAFYLEINTKKDGMYLHLYSKIHNYSILQLYSLGLKYLKNRPFFQISDEHVRLLRHF